MLVKVQAKDLEVLRALQVQTYQQTFGSYIQQADMEHYFAHELSLATIEQELADPESEHYFVLNEAGQPAGFLKFNWGDAQTEQELEHAFEIQRIYVLDSHQGLGLGKEMFDFALEEAQKRGFSWVWLGVWERNFKAQNFYFKYGFEKFSQHEYITGETVDIDWLLRKRLVDNGENQTN